MAPPSLSSASSETVTYFRSSILYPFLYRLSSRFSQSQILLTRKRHVQILPVFVSSEENLLAEAASQLQMLPDGLVTSDRGLSPSGSLFASSRGETLRERRLWKHFAQPCNFRLAYAFPPLLRVVQKISVSSGIFLLVTLF